MTRTPLLIIALAAAAALAGCNKEDHTIVAGGPTTATTANAAANAPVALPPSITASKTYRCDDNSLVYVDWMSDGSARVKKYARRGRRRRRCRRGRAQGRRQGRVDHLQGPELQGLRSSCLRSPRPCDHTGRGGSISMQLSRRDVRWRGASASRSAASSRAPAFAQVPAGLAAARCRDPRLCRSAPQLFRPAGPDARRSPTPDGFATVLEFRLRQCRRADADRARHALPDRLDQQVDDRRRAPSARRRRAAQS